MSRIPLNALPTFVAVAKHQNLRVAAESLHLTHSAVSQQITGLEDRLGFQLFDRRGRRVVLNGAGEALLREVAPALERILEGVQAATVAAHGRQQALRTGEGPWPGLVSERLYEGPTPFVAVGSPGSVARVAGKPLDAVSREPLLGDRDLWKRWFRAVGVEANPVPVAMFNDLSLMLQAAEQDLGFAVVREMFAADALRQGRLVKLSDTRFIHEGASSHHLVYPPTLKDWPPLQALRAWLRAELEASMRSLEAQRRG